MTPRDLSLLFGLAALWGASFLFIKVAVAEMSPLMLVAIRLVLASASLVAIRAAWGRARRATPAPPVSGLWRGYLVVAVMNAIIPYTLIAWGEERISSGTASILNATTPLFTALLAASVMAGVGGMGERLSPAKLLGLLVGFGGVAVLVVGSGADLGLETGRAALLGYGAVLVASAAYGVGGLYGRRAFAGVPPLEPALWQNVFGAVLLVPAALLLTPLREWPSWAAVGSTVALGVGGTGVALVLYYELLARVGATRTVMVTYLLPVMALAYGALLLDEAVGLPALLGLALVLSGIAITARRGGSPAPSGGVPKVAGRG